MLHACGPQSTLASPLPPPVPRPAQHGARTRVHDGAVLVAQDKAAAVGDGVGDADGGALKGAQLEGLPHVDGVQARLVVQVELLQGWGRGGGWGAGVRGYWCASSGWCVGAGQRAGWTLAGAGAGEGGRQRVGGGHAVMCCVGGAAAAGPLPPPRVARQRRRQQQRSSGGGGGGSSSSSHGARRLPRARSQPAVRSPAQAPRPAATRPPTTSSPAGGA